MAAAKRPAASAPESPAKRQRADVHRGPGSASDQAEIDFGPVAAAWRRGAPRVPLAGELRAMVVEVAHDGALVRVHCAHDNGRALCLTVHRFWPYFFVRLPQRVAAAAGHEPDCEALRAFLEGKLASRVRGASAPADAAAAVASVDSQWACVACTLLNPASGAKCEACGSVRPRAAAAEAADAAARAQRREASYEEKEGDGGDDDEGLVDGVVDIASDAEGEEEDEEPQGGALVRSVTLVRRRSLLYFRGDGDEVFARIELASPSLVSSAVAELRGAPPPLLVAADDVFEANVDYDLRFMIDSGLSGGAWFSVSSECLRVVDADSIVLQLEVDWSEPSPFVTFASQVDNAALARIAPLRVLSVHVQGAVPEGRALDPQTDPVWLIANTVIAPHVRSIAGSSSSSAAAPPPLSSPSSAASVWGPHSVLRVLFVLDPRGDSVRWRGEAIVVAGRSERVLLAAWRRFVLEVDPDVVTGFEAGTRDLPLLLRRAEALGLGDFAQLGREAGVAARARKVQIYSAGWVRSKRRMSQTSNQTAGYVEIRGRLFVEMIKVVQTAQALRTYSLQECVAEFLQKTEPLLDAPTVARLYAAAVGSGSGAPGEAAADRLFRYELRQSQAPVELMAALMTLIQTVEMARATGINMKDVWTRGQMLRTWSLLLRQARSQGFLAPTMRDAGAAEAMTSGPMQFDPRSLGTIGLHRDPVAVLDFASLYPSIMIAFNLCFSTLVVPLDERRLESEAMFDAPTGRKFVRPELRKGLLPAVLESLLAARSRVRSALEACSEHDHPELHAVLNERQKALKISANAVYGFTGSSASKIPIVALAEATINYGATTLMDAAVWVHDAYPTARVIYGATDSLMIRVEGASVAEAMSLGREVAARVSEGLRPPMRLQFEKVYCPFLLQQNNHYAGVRFTRPERHDGLDVKGMESVRRDVIPLMRELMESVLANIMLANSIEGALAACRSTLHALRLGRFDLSQLTVTKALWRGTDSEHYIVKQPHTELARRIRERNPGVSIALGQRLSFVFVQRGRGMRQYEKSEDPLFALEHGLPLDLEVYIDHLIKKPLIRLFRLPGLLGSAPEAERVLFGKAQDHVLALRQATPAAAAQRSIASFFAPAAQAKCIGCGAALGLPASRDSRGEGRRRGEAFGGPIAPNPSLCAVCGNEEAEVIADAAYRLASVEHEYRQLEAQCLRCQGSRSDDILCRNVDCRAFWLRHHLRGQLDALAQDLDKLEW